MSMKVYGIGRTVRIIRPYKVEVRNGKNGNFESRMVMWTLATDREYTQAVTKPDGTVAQERVTDFVICRATGPVADRFNQYCSAMKKDENGNDKLVSRRLLVEGHLERYSSTRTQQVQFDNGMIANVSLPEDREIIVVESIQFLDADPVKAKASATTATGTIVQNATTAQTVPMATPVQNVAQPVQNATPVANAVPVQNVAPAQPVANAIPVQNVAQPEVPVVTNVSSEVAPF